MEQETLVEQRFKGKVRPLQAKDISSLKPILETWIRDRINQELLPLEVQETLGEMEKSISKKSDRVHVVAEDDEGRIIGVMGLRKPDEKMMPYALTDNPAEVINAFVSEEYRSGKGVGKALLSTIEQKAKEQGFKEVILNSGPRYKDSAWGFYNKILGEPVGVIKEMYGKGGDAPVWRKPLP